MSYVPPAITHIANAEGLSTNIKQRAKSNESIFIYGTNFGPLSAGPHSRYSATTMHGKTGPGRGLVLVLYSNDLTAASMLCVVVSVDGVNDVIQCSIRSMHTLGGSVVRWRVEIGNQVRCS